MVLNQASALVEPCLLSEEHLPRRPRTGAAENDPKENSPSRPLLQCKSDNNAQSITSSMVVYVINGT